MYFLYHLYICTHLHTCLKLSSSRNRPWDKDQGTHSLFGRWSQEAITERVKKDKEGKEVNTGVVLRGQLLWAAGAQSAGILRETDLPIPRGEEAMGFIHQLLFITQQSQLPGISVLPTYRLSKVFRQKVTGILMKKQKWQFGYSECQEAIGRAMIMSATPSKRMDPGLWSLTCCWSQMYLKATLSDGHKIQDCRGKAQANCLWDKGSDEEGLREHGAWGQIESNDQMLVKFMLLLEVMDQTWMGQEVRAGKVDKVRVLHWGWYRLNQAVAHGDINIQVACIFSFNSHCCSFSVLVSYGHNNGA